MHFSTPVLNNSGSRKLEERGEGCGRAGGGEGGKGREAAAVCSRKY